MCTSSTVKSARGVFLISTRPARFPCMAICCLRRQNELTFAGNLLNPVQEVSILFILGSFLFVGLYDVLFSFILFHFFICFVPLVFLSCQLIWIASICMSYPSYPVRRHVIPLSTLHTILVCSISVSWFVTAELASLWEEESERTLGVLHVDGYTERTV